MDTFSKDVLILGETLATRTQGTRFTSDGLKGNVLEASLADLQNGEVAVHKFKLITENVQGKNFLTVIQASGNVKTTNGCLLRLFCGFHKDTHQLDQKDLLNPAPTDLSHPQDYGCQNLPYSQQLPGGSAQQADSSQRWQGSPDLPVCVTV